MTPIGLGLVAVFAPLVVAAVLLVIRPLRLLGLPAAGLSILGALASLGASLSLLAGRLQDSDYGGLREVIWLSEAGQTFATLGLQLDGISIPMLVVVAIVATCVQVFSVGYLGEEPPADLGRYFAWQSLFLFTMQGLVVSPNLLQLFACWELVGLCSYLLIGFYWRKTSAAQAAVKAFWVTKFADMGLLLGLIVQVAAVGSFGWGPETVAAIGAAGLFDVLAALYFFAVMGKSAQVPLHIWLPDAMEGPTPVSALLHAATMVAAGVFLIVRAYPIFEGAHAVLPAMAVIGGLTALIAACTAIVQTDIKKVLAYSTCSQLGYMIAALGAGSLMGGYFHLTTHAFFKALLFLAAGSVIHAVHSNEISQMGGLSKNMRLTTAVFALGTFALAGLPFLSGFYSKDLILEALFHAATHDSPVFWIPFVACMLTAGLTAYYMGRVLVVAFLGDPKTEAAAHAHEHGILISLPLVVLGVLALCTGYAGDPLAHLWDVHDYHFAILHVTPVGVGALALALTGFLAAWLLHARGMGEALTGALAPLGSLIRSGPIDAAWAFGYRQGLLGLAAVLAWFDRYVIDGLMNAIGAGTLWAGDVLRFMQTGRARDYVQAILLAAAVLTGITQIFMGVTP